MRIGPGLPATIGQVVLPIGLAAAIVVGCAAPIPTAGGGGAAPVLTSSGFPLGSFAKDVQDPDFGRVRLVWTFEDGGRWAEIPFALDGQTIKMPTVRGTYAIDGSAVTLATEFPPDWGTSHHTWRLEGDRLWTSFISSTIDGDADWFRGLDSRPWIWVGR